MFVDLQTQRLLLRSVSPKDRNFIYEQFSNAHINRYLFDAEPLRHVEEADEIIGFYMAPEPRSQHRWILTLNDEGTPIGTCGYHCWNKEDRTVEIGYDLKETYWGKGFMTEALSKIIDFAKENMKVKSINACIYVENQKSIAVVEKFGFERSGEKTELFRNEPYLHHIYTLNI